MVEQYLPVTRSNNWLSHLQDNLQIGTRFPLVRTAYAVEQNWGKE